jgi:tetratricopeptide (TPR) repeat protein
MLRALQHVDWGDTEHFDPTFIPVPGPFASGPRPFVVGNPLPSAAPFITNEIPAPVPDAAVAIGFIPANPRATPYAAEAEDAFRQRDYRRASKSVQHALLEDPLNGRLHLFAAQIAFAVGEYPTAAAATLRGLRLVEETDAFYVVENFRQIYRGDDFVRQMDSLNEFCRQHPEVSFALALRAYQFAGLGHLETAIEQARLAIEAEPEDPLANWILSLRTPGQPEIEAPVPEQTGTKQSVLTD